MKVNYSIIPLTAFILCLAFTGCKHPATAGGKKSSSTVISSGSSDTLRESTPELVSLLHQAALDGDLKGVEEALESGASVNAVEEEGRTALMLASFNGHSEIVLTLLDAGAGVDRRDMAGRTALLYAATGPFPETVRILLDKGAEPNVIDSDEHFTPLMHAAAEGNLDVVKILLEAGSDPSLKDVDGDDAATFARQAGHGEVASFLDTL